MNRRTFLGLLAAGTLLPSPALAADPALDEARRDLARAFRQATLQFDVAQLGRRALERLDAPGAVLDALASLLEGREVKHGFASLSRLLEDPSLERKAEELLAPLARKLSIKRWILHTLRGAPQTPQARQALLDAVTGDLFGLDMAGMRQHVASYPESDLAIVVGPPSQLSELLGLVLREPWFLYLQLVHGRKATELLSLPGDPVRPVLDVLLDPRWRVVLFHGHGTWTSFSLGGYQVDPEHAYAELCTKAAEGPKDFALSLARGEVYRQFGGHKSYTRLSEEDLAPLVEALFPSPQARRAVFKERIVRYTCGAGRYDLDLDLLKAVIPEQASEGLHFEGSRFSSRHPGHPEAYRALATWTAEHGIAVRDLPALGTCLVERPEDTLGFEGLSWMQDFIKDPMPRRAPSAFEQATAAEPPEPAEGEGEGEDPEP